MNLGDFQDRRGNLLRDSLRYNWWIILLFMLVGALLGAGFAIARPAKYSSSATLILSQIVGNPYTSESNSDTLEMLQTEAVSVTSQSIMQQVVDDLNLDPLTPQAIRSRTRISVPPNTQALQITYTSASRILAPQIVSKMAALYLAEREVLANQAIANTDTNIQEQITEAGDQLKAANQAGKRRLATSIESSIIALQLRKADNDTQPTYPGRVLSPPLLPKGSKTAHIITFVIAGMIVAGLFGVAIGLWRERRKDRIRAPSDLDDYAFDAPVTAIHGRTLDDEALRHLRMRLAPQIREHGIVSLVAMSRGQALSTGVLLANSLSGGGTSVVLIDGTGTERGHRDALEKGDQPGFAEALSGDTPKPTAIRINKNFGYLPAGQSPIAAAEHLVEDRARTVVHTIAERYDLTLVATMPLVNVEGEALARLTAGVILLIELDRTSHYDLGVTLKTIASQGHRLLGVFVLPARK